MLKKLLVFMLLAVMLFAFTGCGDEPETEGGNSSQTQTEAPSDTANESKAPVSSEAEVSSKPEESSKPTVTSKPVSSKEEKVTSIDTAGLSGWKKAYAETINDNLKYYTKFALVNLNNDSTPELYMKAKSAKAGDIICYFSAGKAITFKLSKSGGGSYVEKGGMLYNEFELISGKTDAIIYKFDTTGFEKMFFGRFSNNKTNYLMCTDIGLVATEKLQATTKQEFDDKVASFIDLSKAKKLDANAVSLSEFAKKLK